MATTSSYQQIYERRLSQAMQRKASAKSRATTALAREFFSSNNAANAPDSYNDATGDEWRTLPSRLVKLSNYLRERSSSGNGDTNETFPVIVSNKIDESRRVALGAAVFNQAPSTFLDEFRSLFEALLRARQNKWKRERIVDESMEVEDEVEDGDNCEADELLLSEEDQLYQSLSTLGWLSNQLQTPFREALHSVMMEAIKSLIAGDFETEGMLDQTLEWKSQVLVPWVYSVVGAEAYECNQWAAQLDYAASECFVHVRMNELFDLVTDYPESLPAVRELQLALDRTGRIFYETLAFEWRQALVQRLIHPGAQTSQIIDVYINTIKVLREMDPSGELLQVVTQPVREYLRGRNDCVRCIITSLTDEEGGGDLYEELKRQDAKPLEEAQLDEEDEEEPPTFDWQPPPSILQRRGVITGQVGKVSSSSRRAGDILSMLVGIYGSKELFLLSNLEYNTDAEVHKLELLKLRFGESSLRSCEVMVKDIDDSKRIHTNIRSTLELNSSRDDPPVVDAAIVSHIFWPHLQRDSMKHHKKIQSKLDQFCKEYEKLKNPRRLVWMQQLGTVEMEVEAYETDADGNVTSYVKDVTCTPAHATLLANFEDKSQWTLEELSTEAAMSEEMVRKRMGFWVNQRVVQVNRVGEDMIYSLVSASEVNSNDHSFIDHNDDDEQELAVSLGAHEEEEMKVYESYIVGMLSNLGQLPLQRIHTMLKTFVSGSEHNYDKTPNQLAVFLQQLCKEEKLEVGPDGMYKLLKKGAK
ncbi:anaphase-promoting complex subunit 2 [Skeletonema marinoi]|uniref:Anaphase-promoting complex subunit 2 n=1 Tax=Skeletonema marinoi TaxID=267567 RepID=A0AAD8YB17_9STRA|nr:anaphase-promoting complex subunit 2 [Skeletonema marinoi]